MPKLFGVQDWEISPFARCTSPIFVALFSLLSSLVLYGRTAAPDVLSGDSGEFQFAAPWLGVPHPTGYPLYILLAKCASMLPFGSIAYRVTLFSALAGACTVALVALLTFSLTDRLLPPIIAGTAVATSPGLWNAATVAEVYTLHVLLIACVLWLVWQAKTMQSRWLYAAAAITGLGISHHGSFILIGAPLLLISGIFPHLIRDHFQQHGKWFSVLRLMLWLSIGLSPWLFILIQYARMGPFNGLDHGLHPHHQEGTITYFWGAPTSWAEAIDHMFGGVMRSGVFQHLNISTITQTLLIVWNRLFFEYGPGGVVLGLAGLIVLLVNHFQKGIATVWIASATIVYFASLGRSVQDALVFTIPLLLPWALWIGMASHALAKTIGDGVNNLNMDGTTSNKDSVIRSTIVQQFILILILLLTLAWGYSRYPYSNKNYLWLFRTFGEGVLSHMEQHSVVMVRWEHGTILQYLHLVEQQRPDVWIDIVEPEDEHWLKRAQRRYAGQTVYIIGSPDDGIQNGAERIWGTEYAVLFRIHHQDP